MFLAALVLSTITGIAGSTETVNKISEVTLGTIPVIGAMLLLVAGTIGTFGYGLFRVQTDGIERF